MTALTEDRLTQWREDLHYTYPVKEDEIIYAGALVMLDANGLAIAAAEATTLTPGGRAEAAVDATSTSGAVVTVRKGVFKFANSGSNTIGVDDVGTSAYAEDDQTVGNVSTGRSVVGKIRQVDADGVWVEVR